ncbi:hypothetical protein ACFV1W_36650 [Kitasatospora sp. NPDC059648]|uniref:hypothetical protein n=1 Tax=Kitasatospora sp. NPDC059648 TaxID=3346894 RepID=UPI0036AFB8CE
MPSSSSASRRDIVYGHTDLVQDFRARAKAQDSTPTAMRELADANRALKAEAAEPRTELAEERSRTKVMRRIMSLAVRGVHVLKEKPFATSSRRRASSPRSASRPRWS